MFFCKKTTNTPAFACRCNNKISGKNTQPHDPLKQKEPYKAISQMQESAVSERSIFNKSENPE
jgi:hypothetical protein